MIIKNGMNKIKTRDENLLKNDFLKEFLKSLQELKNNEKIVI
jgi:hypothetical protein